MNWDVNVPRVDTPLLSHFTLFLTLDKLYSQEKVGYIPIECMKIKYILFSKEQVSFLLYIYINAPNQRKLIH